MYILLTFDKYLSLSEPFYFDQSKLMTLYHLVLLRNYLNLGGKIKILELLISIPELKIINF